jgi:hypothetical protein
LWCLHCWTFCSEVLWLFEVFRVSIGISWWLFSISRMCRLLLVVWPFSQCWFYQFISMEGLSIFWSLLLFLSSVVYSFH